MTALGRDSTELQDLNDYFQRTRKRKSLEDIKRIARILDSGGYKEWANNPRLYCIFRMLGLLHKLDDVLHDGITDFWIPTPPQRVTSTIFAHVQGFKHFSKVQKLVLAKRLPSLDTWPYRTHISYDGHGTRPMRDTRRIIAQDRWIVDVVQDEFSGKVYTRKLVSRTTPPSRPYDYTEIAILSGLHHRHLTDFIGSYSTMDSISFLFAPVEERNLSQFMADLGKDSNLIAQLQGWMGCLASAILYLHNNSIHHRNITATSILVDRENIIIADFASSVNWKEMRQNYISPRSFGCAWDDGFEDIRGLGDVYLQMLSHICGQNPDKGRIVNLFNDKHGQFTQKYLRTLQRENCQRISGSIFEVVDNILFGRHTIRPTASQVASKIWRLAAVEPAWCHECCIDNLGGEITRLEGRKKNPGSRKPFTEQQFDLVRRELAYQHMFHWESNPRVYTILNSMRRLNLLPAFVNAGVTDTWIPFDNQLLRQLLQNPEVKDDFLQHQELALSQSMDPGLHQHFLDGDVHLKTLKELGCGGFGSVSHCFDSKNNRHVAKKLIPRERRVKSGRATEATSRFRKELEVLRRVTSEGYHHFVRMVGSYTDVGDFAVLFSPVAEMNLEKYLNSSPDITRLKRWFGCLASALNKLHDMRIRHKDIKPQNCLISNGEILLTDFGISHDWSYETRPTTSGGGFHDPRYCAPEVAEWEKRNESADIWSLGCVYLEMYSVIQGKTVEDVRQHFGANGTKRSRYNQNIAAINSWLALLQPAPIAVPPSDQFPQIFQREQLSFLESHPNLSDVERDALWAQRKAELASYLASGNQTQDVQSGHMQDQHAWRSALSWNPSSLIRKMLLTDRSSRIKAEELVRRLRDLSKDGDGLSTTFCNLCIEELKEGCEDEDFTSINSDLAMEFHEDTDVPLLTSFISGWSR